MTVRPLKSIMIAVGAEIRSVGQRWGHILALVYTVESSWYHAVLAPKAYCRLARF